MKINELLEELKSNYSKQTDYPEDFLSPFIDKHKCVKVKENLDVDKHRWYETSIIVFKVDTDEGIKFFGTRACTFLFSEMSSIDDIGWTMNFFEMVEKQEITYVKVMLSQREKEPK